MSSEPEFKVGDEVIIREFMDEEKRKQKRQARGGFTPPYVFSGCQFKVHQILVPRPPATAALYELEAGDEARKRGCLQFFSFCTSDQLIRRSPSDEQRQQLYSGSCWKHYKGGTYQVLAVGVHTETQEALVSYTELGGGGAIWFRPLSMWFDDVGGRPRFESLQKSRRVL